MRNNKAWSGNAAEYGRALYELAVESRNGFGENPDGYGAYLISRWYYDLIRATRE